MGGTYPGFKPVTKCVQVTVGANARVTVHVPGATKAVQAFKHYKPLLGTLGLQMIGGANTGDAGTNDKGVKMFACYCCWHKVLLLLTKYRSNTDQMLVCGCWVEL